MKEEKENALKKKSLAVSGTTDMCPGKIESLVSINPAIITWCREGTEASLIPQ